MIRLYWWRQEIKFAQPKSLLRASFFSFRHFLPPSLKNFGDELSPLLVTALTGESVTHTTGPGKLLAVGSVFAQVKKGDTVWGSGMLNSKYVPQSKEVSVRAVRGPLTKQILDSIGIDCPAIYGDPAILLPLVFSKNVQKNYSVGIVPHYHHLRYFRNSSMDNKVKVINITAAVENVIEEIRSCEIIISSSLHGLIVAEAYGIPTVHFYMKNPLHGSFFKFEDYYGALGYPIHPININAREDITKISKNARFISIGESLRASLIKAAPFNVLSQFL